MSDIDLIPGVVNIKSHVGNTVSTLVTVSLPSVSEEP